MEYTRTLKQKKNRKQRNNTRKKEKRKKKKAALIAHPLASIPARTHNPSIEIDRALL